MRKGVQHLLDEMGISGSMQQSHTRPSSSADISKIMDLFRIRNVWTRTSSKLAYAYSGRHKDLDHRGYELAGRFVHSWLREGQLVLNMQLITEKEAADDYEPETS